MTTMYLKLLSQYPRWQVISWNNIFLVVCSWLLVGIQKGLLFD